MQASLVTEVLPTDSNAAFWKSIPATLVPLGPQVEITPYWTMPSVDAVDVRVAVNSGQMAILSVWDDRTRNVRNDDAGTTPTVAAAIAAWSTANNITSVGNDVWGSTETHTANRAAKDSLPAYTNVPIGEPVEVCSAVAPLEYNKFGNNRLLFVQGDGASHTLTVQGSHQSKAVETSQLGKHTR